MSSLSTNNPLSKHFRQPLMYFRLPSEGNWYPEGTLELSATGEVPIYAMTAKDELTLKTPDALMNGAGTVAVIESCCPSIKDAWKMPAVDVDPVLLAIRLATYGKEMEFKSVCPKCNTVHEKAVDVSVMLDKVKLNPGWSANFKVSDGLEIKLRPQNFEELNKNNMLNFEESKLYKIISDENLPEDKKINLFNEAFKNMITIGIEQISRSIKHIKTPEGAVVEDHKFIAEYLSNCDRKIWDEIKQQLDTIRQGTDYNQLNLICENQECKNAYVAPFVFEQSNFFG